MNAKLPLLTLLLATTVGCQPSGPQPVKIVPDPLEPPRYEYRIESFDRDSIQDQIEKLKKLGLEGWQMSGTLCNNGINGRFVAFQRQVPRTNK